VRALEAGTKAGAQLAAPLNMPRGTEGTVGKISVAFSELLS
jgi:hypothetical protein